MANKGERSEADDMVLTPVGAAHTPYRDADRAPFQGRFSEATAEIEIFGEYAEALLDVEKSTHLYVLYWAHLADRGVLTTATPWGPEPRGVFACRSPARPNPINVCVVELMERKGNRLTVRGLDALDGSLVLDVKPYGASIDSVPGARIGWFEEKTSGR
ncbi:MAG: tRNA (N6-threonylcarbamoyladenosine(37)-N6)-methyltransferase TrmO [Spirochaetales bacterium]|nr:tRNA (N6-threonylcarbamoyladenosine(37)-N6)-methyltransferase TrmO [Spirochaetales bacterium]